MQEQNQKTIIERIDLENCKITKLDENYTNQTLNIKDEIYHISDGERTSKFKDGQLDKDSDIQVAPYSFDKQEKQQKCKENWEFSKCNKVQKQSCEDEDCVDYGLEHQDSIINANDSNDCSSRVQELEEDTNLHDLELQQSHNIKIKNKYDLFQKIYRMQINEMDQEDSHSNYSQTYNNQNNCINNYVQDHNESNDSNNFSSIDQLQNSSHASTTRQIFTYNNNQGTYQSRYLPDLTFSNIIQEQTQNQNQESNSQQKYVQGQSVQVFNNKFNQAVKIHDIKSSQKSYQQQTNQRISINKDQIEIKSLQLDQKPQIKVLQLQNQTQQLTMTCPNCKYLIQTYQEFNYSILGYILKFLLLIMLVIIAPVMIVVVVLISLCFQADIFLNIKKSFRIFTRKIKAWLMIHKCPKCQIIVAESINF